MTEIFVKSFQPPPGLTNDAFVIFPTDVSHYQSDYLTVMSCRPQLRLWSQSTWPEDSFTAEENKQDLLLHVEDNQNHLAYGYMIYSPDRAACYGSLYVNPIAQVLLNYTLSDDERSTISQFDARIDFWTSSECANPPAVADFEALLIKDLRQWFANEWKIRPAFSARRGMTRRSEVYKEIGLALVADIEKTEADGSKVNLLLFS